MIKVTYNACRKFWRRAFRRHENIDAYIEQLVFEDRSYQDLFAAVILLVLVLGCGSVYAAKISARDLCAGIFLQPMTAAPLFALKSSKRCNAVRKKEKGLAILKVQGMRILSKNAEKSRNEEKKIQSRKDILRIATETSEASTL